MNHCASLVGFSLKGLAVYMYLLYYSGSTPVEQTCTNVGLNQIAQFSVTLTLKDCSSPSPRYVCLMMCF